MEWFHKTLQYTSNLIQKAVDSNEEDKNAQKDSEAIEILKKHLAVQDAAISNLVNLKNELSEYINALEIAHSSLESIRNVMPIEEKKQKRELSIRNIKIANGRIRVIKRIINQLKENGIKLE